MESLEEIKLRLASDNPEQKIDALLDAWEYGAVGIELVVNALQDRDRKVRQSAHLLLSESDEEIAKQALWNYISFTQMQCLHTIAEFNLDCSSCGCGQHHHFQNLTISNFNDTLVSYWHLSKYSCIHIWHMVTGESKHVFDTQSNYFALGRNGIEAVFSYYECLFTAEGENLDEHYPYSEVVGETPTYNAFAVCSKSTIVAVGSTYGGYRTGVLQIKDYKTNNCYLHYSFEGCALSTHYPVDDNLWQNKVPPLFFTPDESILVAHFVPRWSHSLVRLWDVQTGELIQSLKNLPKLTITSVGVRPDRTIIACGIREDKVCAWELQGDKIIYSTPEMSPCILSTDGRVLIYATANNEIVIRDLVAEQDLCVLQGHNAPIWL